MQSSTLVLSYLMRKENWNFKQACEHVRKYRPQILPNLGFEKQLKMYQPQLREQMSLTPRPIGTKTRMARHRLIRSTNKEQSFHLSLVPMQSSPRIVHSQLKGSSPKKLDFNVRAVKHRNFESRAKMHQRTRSTLESRAETPLNI